MRDKKPLFVYLILLPLVVIAILLWSWNESNKRYRTPISYWDESRETYVRFATVQTHARGTVEIHSRGKDFFKPGITFMGEWLIWNKGDKEVSLQLHLWMYDDRMREWVKYTGGKQVYTITLKPGEKAMMSTVGYIDPYIIWDLHNQPLSRSATINLVVSNPKFPVPDFRTSSFKINKNKYKLYKVEEDQLNHEQFNGGLDDIDSQRQINPYQGY